MSNYFNYNKKSEKEKQDEDDSLETIGKAVGALAGAAFAVWGIAKLFTSSSSEEESSSSSKSHFMTNNNMQPMLMANNNMQPMMASVEGATANTRFITPEGIAHEQAPTVSKGATIWSLPKKGWLKLNTDASATKYPVAVGGVFRDDQGLWVCGFARKMKMDECPPERTDLAELLAIKVGLETAVMKRFNKNIEIETDSEAALGHLNRGVRKNDDQAKSLVEACKELIKKLSPWEVELEYLNGKANRDADKMADLGRRLSFGKTTYFSMPPEGKNFPLWA